MESQNAYDFALFFSSLVSVFCFDDFLTLFVLILCPVSGCTDCYNFFLCYFGVNGIFGSSSAAAPISALSISASVIFSSPYFPNSKPAASDNMLEYASYFFYARFAYLELSPFSAFSIETLCFSFTSSMS